MARLDDDASSNSMRIIEESSSIDFGSADAEWEIACKAATTDKTTGAAAAKIGDWRQASVCFYRGCATLRAATQGAGEALPDIRLFVECCNNLAAVLITGEQWADAHAAATEAISQEAIKQDHSSILRDPDDRKIKCLSRRYLSWNHATTRRSSGVAEH
jgi:hypothetical protein